MSIPIDKLYHYIESIAQEVYNDDIVIYHFYPYGSKNLSDFKALRNVPPFKPSISLPIYCHDQEPLNYNYFQSQHFMPTELAQLCIDQQIPLVHNLRRHLNIYDFPILVHSEKRSSNLKKYQDDGYVSVYYWSHAIIALDWFRFAQYEKQVKDIKKTFLIYNRAWCGTREYRLKIVDLLIENKLLDYCQVNFNPVDPELNEHYTTHKFINLDFCPAHQLENYISKKLVSSCSSADYDIDDYNATEFEVVLETLFDDDRLHLTEKIFRPIALGQPFILAGTAGSLDYIKSYGFKTFASVIDESYDLITNPIQRLLAIIKTMKDITTWTDTERKEKYNKIKEIVDYNKAYLFSDKFFNFVTRELYDNLKSGIEIAEKTNLSSVWTDRVNLLRSNDVIKDYLLTNNIQTANDQQLIINKVNKYYRRILPKE